MTVVMAASCGKPAPSEEQFRTWVLDRYAEPFRNGDTERWLEVFGEGAVGMHHTLPVLEGREAIREFGRMVHENLVVERFDLSVDEVRINYDWALTRGSFASRLVPKEQSVDPALSAEASATVGKFIFLWERERDGEWRITLDMGNLDSP